MPSANASGINNNHALNPMNEHLIHDPNSGHGVVWGKTVYFWHLWIMSFINNRSWRTFIGSEMVVLEWPFGVIVHSRRDHSTFQTTMGIIIHSVKKNVGFSRNTISVDFSYIYYVLQQFYVICYVKHLHLFCFAHLFNTFLLIWKKYHNWIWKEVKHNASVTFAIL